jgi:DNA-binding NarL/FixJ family response regulator
MKRIRILLVDDQQLFVENLKTVLDLTTQDIEVVAIARDGKEALEMMARHRPEIVLMDVRMPVMDGVEATKIIHQQYPNVKILMLTTFSNDDYVLDALNYGAHGYILKSIRAEELQAAIRTVSAGGVVIAPKVADKLFRRNAEEPKAVAAHDMSESERRRRLATLSEREAQLVSLISQAYSNREIAERMFISEQTVKNYSSRVYAKLGVSKRSQLMREYFHLIKPETEP